MHVEIGLDSYSNFHRVFVVFQEEVFSGAMLIPLPKNVLRIARVSNC